MAEELDDFGIPIRKSQSAPVDSGGDVDDFGIPIKKKTQSKNVSSPSVTSGGKSNFQYSNPLTTDQPDNSFSIQPEELRQQKINDPTFDVTLSLGNKKPNTLSPNLTNQGTFSEAITDNLSGRRTDNTTRALQNAVSAYDAAQGAGSSMENVTNANMIAEDRKELGAMESVGNSFSNMVNRIQGAIPRLNIVATDALEKALGKDLTKSWYELEGRDVDEVRNNAYKELDELSKEVKPTLGVLNSIQSGSVKDFAAGFVNAITSLGSTAVPSLLTGGAGLFTEMIGDSIVDFNNIKAKRLGVTQDELYSSGQADFTVPSIIGGLAGGMELIGLKGVGNLITGKIAGTGMRKAALFFGETQKEGLTELIQEGLTEGNNSLANGESIGDASKAAVDAMFSKKGLESYLQGTLASSGAGGLGHVYKSVTSQKAKSSIAQDISNIGMAELDLQNPAVSPESKAVIAGQMNQAVSSIADAVESDFEVMDKLSPEQNKQVVEKQSQIESLQSVVEDPAVTTQTKAVVESQIAPLELEVEEIINTVPEVKSTESNEEIEPIVPAEQITETTEVIQEPEVSAEESSEIVTVPEISEETEIITPEVETVAEEEIQPPKSYGYEDIDAMVNEKEVADNLQQEIESPTELTPVQQVIREAGGFTTTQESLSRFGDINSLGDQMAKSYLNKTKGLPLDKIAESLSKEGLEVTPQDLVEYMEQFPNGNTTYSGRAKALQEKLFDMTGKKYNKFTVKKFRDRLEQEALRRMEAEPERVNEETIRVINEEGITADNIDAQQDYIEFVFDTETFENIKKYLDGTKSEQEGNAPEVNQETDGPGAESGSVEQQTSKTPETSKTPKTEKTKVEDSDIESPEEKAGDVLRRFASKAREGKINKLGGFKAATGFDAAWDLSLEAIALSLEGGAKVADAIESGLKTIRKTDWYKNLGEKEDFDAKYTEHMNNEYKNEEQSVQESPLKSGEQSGNRLEDTAKTRKEMGFDEYERVGKGDINLNAKADAAIADGSIKVGDILAKIENGDATTDVEQVILRKYIVSLEASIAKSPNAESISELKRAIDLSDQSGTAAGRALAARKGSLVREDNLANFLMDEMAADGLNNLTQQEIDDLKKKWEVGDEAKRKYEEGYAKAVDDMMKKRAAAAVQRAKAKKKSVSSKARKSHTEYVSERQKLKDSIREKLRKSRGQLNATVPYLNELIAIAPDVAKLVKSYVEEGYDKLEDIVTAIHNDLKDDIEGIQEEDVLDLIAGNYNEKKLTKNAIQEKIVDLRLQAKLLTKIEDLENGIENFTSKKKRQVSSEVEKLLARIKELEVKNTDEVEIDPEAKEASRLKTKKTWLKNQIAKMQKDIEEGNFDEEVKPMPIKLDKEAQKYQDEYIAFLKETNMRRDKARYERQSPYVKAWDKFQQITGLRRLVQTSIDFSMPFRQGITVTLNPRHVRITAKAFSEMFKGAFSVKKYDRMMFAIQQSDRYNDMIADKLKFNEVDSVDNLNRNEDYRTSFIYKIPILREPLLASERAAAGFINTARFELYTKMARNVEAQGFTRQNSPETFLGIAKWVNNMTGRGNLLTFIEESNQGQRIAGNTFFGARLMASRFNLLNPLYYQKMPKALRVQALADMGSFTSVVIASGLAAAAAGATVSFDPDSPDFLKAKWGDKRYDFTGGLSQYIRTYLRITEAIYYRLNPNISKNKANKKGAFAAMSTQSFFRYKLAPNTGYTINAITGKDPLGNDWDPWEIFYVYPMYVDDLRESYAKDGGLTAGMAIFLPNIFGVGVQEYNNGKEAKTDDEKKKAREDALRKYEEKRR